MPASLPKDPGVRSSVPRVVILDGGGTGKRWGLAGGPRSLQVLPWKGKAGPSPSESSRRVPQPSLPLAFCIKM